MLDRLDRYEAEYRRRLARCALAVLAAQVLLITLRVAAPAQFAIDTPERRHLGYPGPDRFRPELEVLEPNSVQAYFYQKAREGRTQAIDYRVLQPIDLTPGPNAIVQPRNIQKPQPKPRVDPQPDDLPEIVEPQVASHAPLSFSKDFQIIRLVKPVYPEYELQRGIRAELDVAVWLTPQGDVDRAEVRETRVDPPTASPRAFELATLEAIRMWKVRPRERQQPFEGMPLYLPILFDPESDVFLDLDRAPVR